MSDLIGTQWREKDNRFERVVEIVKTGFIGREVLFLKTVSFTYAEKSKAPSSRVTRADAEKFMKRFERVQSA